MDSKQIWAVVLVAIVASAITAIATVSITGNAVKAKTPMGYVDVYTKAEVDAQLRNVTTSQGVLAMLNKCRVISGIATGNTSITLKSCSSTCSGLGTCTLATLTKLNMANGALFQLNYFNVQGLMTLYGEAIGFS